MGLLPQAVARLPQRQRPLAGRFPLCYRSSSLNVPSAPLKGIASLRSENNHVTATFRFGGFSIGR